MTLKEQPWTMAVCLAIFAATGVLVYHFLQPML
jgi:hypothetical protein